MTGDGDIARRANRNRTGVSVDRYVLYSGVMECDIKSDVAVVDWDRPVACRRADQRFALRNRHDQGACRINNVALVRLCDWNSSFLILERRENLDGLDVSGIERHPHGPASYGICGGRGIGGRGGAAFA